MKTKAKESPENFEWVPMNPFWAENEKALRNHGWDVAKPKSGVLG